MARLKFKVNLFDAIAVMAIIAVAIIIGMSYCNKPYLGSGTLAVEVKITDVTTADAILPKLISDQSVYYSGTKYPVKQVGYRVDKDTVDKVVALYIDIEGPGDMSSNRNIFNGQLIFVNQKVEIHSDYQVQGIVTGFEYAQ